MENYHITEYLLNTLKTTPKLLNKKLKPNNKELNKKEEYYYFKNEIDNFLKEDTNNRLFIMTGLRGVGKTTILYQLYDYLNNELNISNNRILYLDLERLKDFTPFNLLNYLDIFIKDINEEYYLEDERIFIFVDETQYADNWDSVGKIIFDETTNVFLIFTGLDTLTLNKSNATSRRSLKKEVHSLNFSQYLNLKYNQVFPLNLKDEFINVLFQGETEGYEKIEKNIILNNFTKLRRETKKEWMDYIQFGNFPSTLNSQKEYAIQLTLENKDKIIEKDMLSISSFNKKNIQLAHSILNILAIQKPGDISLTKLANILDISKKTVNDLLFSLKQTNVIFNIGIYGSIAKRERKTYKYYFTSTQIKSSICLNSGLVSRNSMEHIGYLAEDLVASTLFRIKKEKNDTFGIYYDTKEDNNVDFIVNTLSGKNIPIEVGNGNKNKKQIKSAINRYGADYGIVISNKTPTIKKEGNVIFLPLTTFSLI